MGILDELRASYGDDVLAPRERTVAENWADLCVCGHIDRYHSPSVGGHYTERETEEFERGGEQWVRRYLFDGCIGALLSRGKEPYAWSRDEATHTLTGVRVPTCPCEEMRPVVRVDRPNRYFNQRVPLDPNDQSRHPFIVGIRAFTTHLSKRKAALADSTWATAEFTRRFIWIDGARSCAISRCRETADVWPCYPVDGTAHSELRCGSHRPV